MSIAGPMLAARSSMMRAVVACGSVWNWSMSLVMSPVRMVNAAAAIAVRRFLVVLGFIVVPRFGGVVRGWGGVVCSRLLFCIFCLGSMLGGWLWCCVVGVLAIGGGICCRCS